MTQPSPHALLAELRAALPVTVRCAYLQTGSLGPPSQPVLQAIQEAEWLAAQEGPAAPAGLTPLVAASDGARTALARLLNVPATELAWSLNTSTAMRTVVQSLRLTGADRLITSDQEHVATRSLYNGLRDEVGLPVVVLSTAGQPEDLLARLEIALRQPTRGRNVVLLSHVSCIDGRRLPVTEAVALTRRGGGISLIDGAQAVGQFPVDLRQLDADFYIGSGHKWLLGPSGIGYIHVHRDRLASFNPNWLPDADRPHATAAALGEAGTTNLAQRAGLQVAVEQMLAIGLETAEAHCAQLAQQLRAGLQALPGVTVLGPADPAQTTGLVGFTVQGWRAEEGKALVERLYQEQQILIKYQPEQSGLRVSLAVFNTAEEVARLLAALESLCGHTSVDSQCR
ncbi:MAG: aminotransferase class V-fold PLP-dependent enzyme [Caldilineaceae bacterium]